MPLVLPRSSEFRKRKLARILVRPPNRPSNGAQTINNLLGEMSRLSRRSPVPRQYRAVVNWGNPSPLEVGDHVRIVNKPQSCSSAINKLSAMSTMQAEGVRVPEFTREPPEEARGIWLARTSLTGSGGAGIKVVRRGDAFPAAPLYVKYVPKLEEWRVHVAFGKGILAQKKLRQSNNEQTADQKLIRNHDNGWVFAPRTLDADQSLMDEAIKAVSALGLDFGAVDIVVGKDDGLPYVLEVNTAPGIESPTVKAAYEEAFKEALL